MKHTVYVMEVGVHLATVDESLLFHEIVELCSGRTGVVPSFYCRHFDLYDSELMKEQWLPVTEWQCTVSCKSTHVV
jgi:hypothetical protein